MAVNVLIVDDSAIIRKMVRRTLGMLELGLGDVHDAGDGIEALQSLEDHWVDIVFTDLNMPNMGGMELVQRMADEPRFADIPVVVISSDRSRDRTDALAARGITVVRKPFSSERIEAALVAALGRRP